MEILDKCTPTIIMMMMARGGASKWKVQKLTDKFLQVNFKSALVISVLGFVKILQVHLFAIIIIIFDISLFFFSP